MDIILNDKSICGQFETEEAFADALVDVILPMLKSMESMQASLLKSDETYKCLITKNKNFLDIVYSRSYPEFVRLKSIIVQLYSSNPYWQHDSCYDVLSEYDYPFKTNEPNSFTEAIDRKIGILSFPEGGYDGFDYFACKKNDDEILVSNIRRKHEYLMYVLKNCPTRLCEAIELAEYSKKITIEVSEECRKSIDDLGLSSEDVINIFANLDNMIDAILNGRKNRFWDRYADETFEYRLTISDNRELRIYFLWGRKIILLWALIKKTGRIEGDEKKHILSVAKKYKSKI